MVISEVHSASWLNSMYLWKSEDLASLKVPLSGFVVLCALIIQAGIKGIKP